MSTWNYRVIKSTDEHGETLFQIHEAFYNDNGELSLITENPVSPAGETLDELRVDLERMLEDLRRPILEAGKIQFAKLAEDDDSQSITLDELSKELKLGKYEQRDFPSTENRPIDIRLPESQNSIAMDHSDFRIGMEFWNNGATTPTKWRCTDIGTRVIVAIKLDRDDDPSWYNGPPYAVAESVFDEDDMEACGLYPEP